MFNWHLLSILNGLDVIRLFYFAGIPLLGGDILRVLGQNDPQNVQWEKHTCWAGISLRQTASFERATVREIISIRLACAGAQDKKRHEGMKKSQEVYISRT